MSWSADTPEVHELRKAIDSLRVIGEMGRRVTSSLKITDLAQVLHQSLELMFPIDTFGLAFYSDKQRLLVSPYNWVDGVRLPGVARVPVEGTLTGWALTHRTTLVITDVRDEIALYLPAERQALYLQQVSFLSAVYLPLYEDNELLGVVTVQSRSVAGYTEVHARFLESLAGFITVALRNGLNHRKIQRLNRQMRLLARTDQLTGLANRRALSEFLERTISYSRRHAQSFAVLFFDLDGFKPINDNWGHAAGDHVLTKLAQRLGAAVREHDLVARVGGDEFIAVALGVGDRANAEALAEKVLSAVAEPVVWLERELTVGASIGLALYPEHGASADILVTTADNAMYRAKNTGKHRFDWATKPGA